MNNIRHRAVVDACSVAWAIAILMIAPCIGGAAQLKTLGRLRIPRSTPVIAICTDSVMQTVLTQDFSVARRTIDPATAPVTITVTMHQQVLQPGVSAQDVAPGDPIAASLLEELGVGQLPLGDTGDRPTDPYESVARLEATRPEGALMQQMREYQARQNAMSQPSSPLFGHEDVGNEYPTAIVARVTSNAHEGSLTVAAILAPGEEVRGAKELIAEEIANDVLH